ncbi:MAG: type II toxin-antitoxin system VapC family toxin [Spirochaetaceae bacterium]|nr:type II toxin-antitoxin system VapC family toxin [Spirochaetaceae bacterium]
MIKFLLDTNVLLWYFEDSKRINSIKKIISSEDSDIYYSAVSFWEILIKMRIGKLNINIEELHFFVKQHAFNELPITSDHAKAYLKLPYLHKDPFDHMILTQAITCPMRLITGDPILANYSSLVMVI